MKIYLKLFFTIFTLSTYCFSSYALAQSKLTSAAPPLEIDTSFTDNYFEMNAPKLHSTNQNLLLTRLYMLSPTYTNKALWRLPMQARPIKSRKKAAKVRI